MAPPTPPSTAPTCTACCWRRWPGTPARRCTWRRPSSALPRPTAASRCTPAAPGRGRAGAAGPPGRAGAVTGAALIGADGLWSRTRTWLLGAAPRLPGVDPRLLDVDPRLPQAVAPRVTGHLAYRALVPQAALPDALRTGQITVWLGPQLHAVHYPVRRGELQNLVV